MTELRKVWIADESDGSTVHIDNLSNSLEVIDYAHHEIHGGSTFVQWVNTSSAASVNLAWRNPSGTKRGHVVFEYASESKAHLTVSHGATWTTNTGTVATPRNLHLASGTTSMMQEDKTDTPNWTSNGILKNVTGISGGTTVVLQYNYGAKQVGGGGITRDEIVLEGAETYTAVLTSDDGNKALFLKMTWYEHTDRV